ncbi:MAG: hypothetical protein JO235_19115 [Chroococcidiopsidaceae cyanobacterium CP_BM_RX_35]|nr:hypothetical protein [Chroococcidiopsidaceae cyanobacterium CP_BM_RX_35]
MLSIGMETIHGQILATLRNDRRLVWLSVLANFILVPLLGFVIMFGLVVLSLIDLTFA